MIEMTLANAQRIAAAAFVKAAELNCKLTVSVVDEAGRLVLTLRGDGAGFLTPESSRAKAVAAAAYKTPTSKLAEASKTNPFFLGVPAMSGGTALPTGGAVPIIVGRHVIGGVGCGGGTPDEDEVCAAAGAAAAG